MSISQANPITGATLAGLISAYHDGSNHIGIEQADLLSPTMTEAIRRAPSQAIRQINTNFVVPAKFFGIHTTNDTSAAELAAAGAGTFRLRDYGVNWRDIVTRAAAVTYDATADTVQWVGHGASAALHTFVGYTTGGMPGGLVTRTLYHIVNATADTFQLSLTDGGAPINLTSAGSGCFGMLLNKSKCAPDGVSGKLDAAVAMCSTLGMDIIFDCSHPPASLSIDGTSNNRVSASVHVTNFFGLLKTRYAGKIKYWEAWNEPNDAAQFSGTISAPSNDLLLYTGYWYDAVTLFGGPEKVISPSFNVTTGVGVMDSWLGTYGGNAKIHIFGFHPYRGGNVQLGYSNRILDSYIAVAKARSPGKEIWITEVGESYPSVEVLWRAHLYAAAAGVARLCWYNYDMAAGKGDMRVTAYPGLPDQYKAMMTACAGQTVNYVNECADRRIGVGVGATDTIY